MGLCTDVFADITEQIKLALRLKLQSALGGLSAQFLEYFLN